MGNFESLLNFEIEEIKENFVCIKMKVEKKYLNKIGVIHGGLISTLLDTAGAYSGAFCPLTKSYRASFTISLNLNFINNTNKSYVYAKGCKIGGGRNIWFANMNLYDDKENLLASANGSYKYIVLKDQY